MENKEKNFMYPLVSLCIPFSRNPLPDWAFSLAAIVAPMNATFERVRTLGVRRDIARESMAEESMKRGSKYVLCLDDDVTVPPNIIQALLYQFSNLPDDVGVIGGVYCTKTSPAMPLVFKDLGDGPFYKWKLGDVFECDIIATGMMMIRTEVFKDMSKPWFKDMEGVEESKSHGIVPEEYGGDYFAITDDGYFCRKVEKAGFKVMAHGGVLGLHWDNNGTAYALPSDSYPVKSEVQRRWGKIDLESEKGCNTYLKHVFKVYKDYYGCVDLLPMEQEMADYVP